MCRSLRASILSFASGTFTVGVACFATASVLPTIDETKI